MLPKILILEGINGTGKTTLEFLIHKKTNYKYIIINRFTGSQYVYDKQFNRNSLNEFVLFESIEEQFKDFALLIYLKTTDEKLTVRFNNRNEIRNIILNSQTIEKLKKYYLEYLYKTKFHFIVFDTTNMKPDFCADYIIKTIESEEL